MSIGKKKTLAGQNLIEKLAKEVSKGGRHKKPPKKLDFFADLGDIYTDGFSACWGRFEGRLRMSDYIRLIAVNVPASSFFYPCQNQ